MGLPRWGIVTTADAPAALLLCHAAYHLQAGAAEVHLFLDRAGDAGLAARLGALPGCRVTVTDRAWWRGQGRRRPQLHQVRQTVNATAALGACGVDYLLHLDIDEYLWQWEPLGEELALVPAGAFLRIGNVERIFGADDAGGGVFTSTFRVPDMLFGEEEGGAPDRADGLTEGGLTGHVAGKAAMPRGQGYVAGIHRPRYPGKGAPRFPRSRLSETATILHFDGFTPLDWVVKLLRKAEAVAADPRAPASETRLRQVGALLAEGTGLAAAMALHDRLKRLTPGREAALRAEGRVMDIAFDPGPALARLVPDQAADLSAAAYDRWLLDEKGAILARFGLDA